LRIELREERAFAPSELVAEAAATPQNPDGDDVRDASFVARVRRTLIFMYGDNSPFKALLIAQKGRACLESADAVEKPEEASAV
jgi:hypothetical protein